MNKIAKIGEKAPLLSVSDWVKGAPNNLDLYLGKVVLVEVFQVNCPGCFIFSLPQAIDLYQRYYDKGLMVIGLATAFEDFDKNTLNNLELLIYQNQVVGETLKALEQENRLIDGHFAYSIPFPVAMDNIVKKQKDISQTEITRLINLHIPDYLQKSIQEQQFIQQQALLYLQSRLNTPETFNLYQLQGTPSHIIVDKKGILRAREFGLFSELEWLITNLLHE